MLISAAMQRGEAPDPFDAILLGVMPARHARVYASSTAGMSDESLCALRIKKLHSEFPILGRDVRLYPALAAMLEKQAVLPRIQPCKHAYQQDCHLSLWGAIASLSNQGLSKDDIAQELAEAGL